MRKVEEANVLITIGKLLLDRNKELIGYAVYAEKEGLELMRSKGFNEKGKEEYETLTLNPKEPVILDPYDLDLNEKRGVVFANIAGDEVYSKSYYDEKYEVTRYETHYSRNNRPLTRIKRDRGISKEIASGDILTKKEIEYLMRSYFKYVLVPLEVI